VSKEIEEQGEGGGWKPILGLSDEAPAARPAAKGTVYDQPEPEALLELTVIVPARNEEASIGACVGSLVAQSEKGFELGVDWELVVVDDHSTDRTAEIAAGYEGVTVIKAEKLTSGWTGKNNAVWTAAKKARGRWILFTDADTVHEPGDLGRAIHEAKKHKVGLLSYSPRQIVGGLSQRALMALVFSELSVAYPPAKVSDPHSKVAAANGQFLLFEREAYRRAGGHASVASEVLEDVELARIAKNRKLGVRFRYAGEALSTRMYRTSEAMIEGWSKNLALLFDGCLVLALWRVIDFCLLFLLPPLAVVFWNARIFQHSAQWLAAGWVLVVLWIRNLFRFYGRVAKSNFGFVNCLLAPVGLPLFVVLLVRSWMLHRVQKRVRWKGRSYEV